MFFHPNWLIQIYWTHASHYQENPMFRWAIIFAIIAIIAIIASFLGFGNIAGLSKEFAYIFLIIAVVLFVIGFVGGRRR